MRVILSKWGNSLAFRVPNDMAKLAGFEEGQALELTLDGQSIVLSRKRYDLGAMLKQMEGRKWPALELDEPPVGSEIL